MLLSNLANHICYLATTILLVELWLWSIIFCACQLPDDEPNFLRLSIMKHITVTVIIVYYCNAHQPPPNTTLCCRKSLIIVHHCLTSITSIVINHEGPLIIVLNGWWPFFRWIIYHQPPLVTTINRWPSWYSWLWAIITTIWVVIIHHY